jgi:hypothetical protein
MSTRLLCIPSLIHRRSRTEKSSTNEMLCIHNKYYSHDAADAYQYGRFEQYRANDHREIDSGFGQCRIKCSASAARHDGRVGPGRADRVPVPTHFNHMDRIETSNTKSSCITI